MIQSINLYISLIYWGIIGILVGTGFTKLIEFSINNHFKGSSSKNFDLSIFAFSAARVMVAGMLMFFAFKQDILVGLIFLAAFIISRWVWLFMIIRQQIVQG